MASYARSLALTAALLVAAAVSILAGADQAATPHRSRLSSSGHEDARQQQVRRQVTAALPSPISLSDPDGQELILEHLDVRVAIHGMLSLTELEFRFRNPTAKRMEGRFACTLPANAAISRFAKEVNGRLMEGEVVERLRANQVYEQYLHQMRDPALLEQDQGNRFSARIFPIEANDSVRILLSYSMLIPMRDGARTYSFPLRGYPEIKEFEFRASVAPLAGERVRSSKMAQSSVDVFSMEERDYRPDEDIELRVEGSAASGSGRVLRAGGFYLAALRPVVRVAAAAAASEWSFYVDTSASSAEGAEHRIRALEALLDHLPSTDAVEILAFDNAVVPLATGSASSLAGRVGDLLRARLFLGGTDLGAAIRHAARGASARPQRAMVFVSDLVATLGSTVPAELAEAARLLPARSQVHAVILGSREDSAIARQITAGRGRILKIPFTTAFETVAADTADALRRPVGASIRVSDAAAEWTYPASFDDVQPGDEIIVLGRSRTDPQVTASGITSVSTSNLSAATFEPLLEREAYRAYLEYLGEREASEPSEAIRRALATEQIRISIEQRVVIPRTTMLVLENEWEYQRWGLDRRALAAILTIDSGGIGRVDREPAQRRFVTSTPPPPPARKTNAEPDVRRDEERVAQPQNVIGLERGVVGGVAGGVVGGVVDSSIGGATYSVADSAAPTAVRETIGFMSGSSSTARQQPAASMAPAPLPAPPRPAEEEKQVDQNWTGHRRPSRDDIGELRARLRDDPRDRALYNRLSDQLVASGEWRMLRDLAVQWQPYDPENPQVYEILGVAAEHLDHATEAARAYASLIEIAPAKPELLQRAGLLLVRVGGARLAETPLRRALELRPDRVNSYRHLALMLWLDGRPEEAASILESALKQTFPTWYGDAHRVVRDELASVYRSWGVKSPQRRAEIEDRAQASAVDLHRRDALRFTLAWETDANDVDLHVVDPSGEECFYGHPRSRSGLELYQDITQGLGPEVIRTAEAERGTYHVGVRYFAAGPMGVSRGLVVIIRSSGASEPSVEVVPFRLVEGGGPIRKVVSFEVK